MNENELKCVLEALLMSSDKPLSVEQLLSVFDDSEKPARADIFRALNTLKTDYANRAIELKELAHGYCLQTREQYGLFISRLQTDKPQRYSRALLETIAIIAYKQPVTRADIEEIRGVALSTPMLKTLLEREWVKIAGYRDVPGKPAIYCTTKTFLDYFNLASLDQLPPLPSNGNTFPAVTEQLLEECSE